MLKVQLSCWLEAWLGLAGAGVWRRMREVSSRFQVLRVFRYSSLDESEKARIYISVLPMAFFSIDSKESS